MFRKRPYIILFILLFIFSFSVLHTVQAHEVYVLSPQEISSALSSPSPQFLTVLDQNAILFSVSAFIGILIVLAIFLLSISRYLEKKLDPFFARTKHWAPIISRVTVGLSFLASAYYQASYGPELPLATAYGSYTRLITVVLVIIGILIIANLYVRIAAVIAILMYAYTFYRNNWYMLTYTNYLGEILVLLILGSHKRVLDNAVAASVKIIDKIKPYSFLILRVLFGVALIYASFYAKILHSNLAFITVEKYHLTNYLHFEPRFLVLGTACVEILIGLFFVLGIEIRATSLFILFWLTQSLLFFGEVVWPHIILIGIPIAFFFYGYDKYSIEGYFFKKGGREPVL